jgi:hypothetical protein
MPNNDNMSNAIKKQITKAVAFIFAMPFPQFGTRSRQDASRNRN